MNLFLGIVFGFVLGAIILYFVQQNKIKLADKKLLKARQALEESESLNQRHTAQIEEIKVKYQSQISDLQNCHQNQIEQWRVDHQSQIQELTKSHQSKLQENRQLIEQYKSQIQQLTEESEAQQTIDESLASEDFREGDEEESIEEIESLLDIVSDIIYEPETPIEFIQKLDLEQQIMAWGETEEVTAIPQLIECIYHPESRTRTLVASVLGKIADSRKANSEIQKIIPALGKLSGDTDPLVRQSAVEALGKIKSPKVIWWLKIAKRDPDSDVVKIASAALTKFKGYRVQPKKKPVKKNAKLIQGTTS